ncbi:unnamed protein product [Diamesa serratosioi]
MAEKPEEKKTNDEKLVKAKELYGRGCRNFYVKLYNEAADDLAESSQLMGEVVGVDGDELGVVYLLYAKALVECGKMETKVVNVPEGEDEDGEGEGAGEEEDDDEDEEESNEADADMETEDKEKPVTNGASNGHGEAQAGPSGINGTSAEEETEAEAGNEGSSFDIAWEVLLNAESIFENQGAAGLPSLVEVYTIMGEVSFENGDPTFAAKEYNRAIDCYENLDVQDKTIAAELYYRIGLCRIVEKKYKESVESLKLAEGVLNEIVAEEKAKVQTEETIETLKHFDETLQDLKMKILEINEAQSEEIADVKKELSKLFGPDAGGSSSADGAGTSSSGGSSSKPVDKPKPMDISHLIKRKKPDTASDVVEGSPAKKAAMDISPEVKEPIDSTIKSTSPTADKIPEDLSTVKLPVDI